MLDTAGAAGQAFALTDGLIAGLGTDVEDTGGELNNVARCSSPRFFGAGAGFRLTAAFTSGS
jgi:hypothetical protein